MFNMKRETFVNEIGVQAQAFSDFEGNSAAYLGSIKATIEDLKATNEAIEQREKIVTGLIDELMSIEGNLKNLRAENKAKIDALSLAFDTK